MIILWCWLAARASIPSLEHYKVEYGVRPHTIPKLWAYVWTFDHHWQRSLNAVPSSVWCIALCDFNTLSMMNLLLGCQCEFCCHHFGYWGLLQISRMSKVSVNTTRSRYVREYLYVVLLLLWTSFCCIVVVYRCNRFRSNTFNHWYKIIKGIDFGHWSVPADFCKIWRLIYKHHIGMCCE